MCRSVWLAARGARRSTGLPRRRGARRAARASPRAAATAAGGGAPSRPPRRRRRGRRGESPTLSRPSAPPPWNDCAVNVTALSDEQAAEIAEWRYDFPYEWYDTSADPRRVELFANPTRRTH